MLGEVVKDWRVVSRLGKGGRGEVWRADAVARATLPSKVAIKFLAPDISSDGKQVQRFFDELSAAARIDHTATVKLFDIGMHAGRAYAVMELLEGETLAARIRRLGKLPLGNATDLARQLAELLAAAHAAKLTHGDVEPDNIFLVATSTSASSDLVKLLDFGAARLGTAGRGLIAVGSLGAPAYMAPEQWNDASKADAPADVYGLACATFEMCCGRTPFIAASVGESCTKHLNEKPPRLRALLARVPLALDDLLDRMLAKPPADRPRMTDVATALAAVAHALPAPQTLTIEATRPHRTAIGVDTTLGSAAAAVATATRTRPRRSRLRPLLAIASVFALAGTLGFVLLRDRLLDDDSSARSAAPPAPAAPPVSVAEHLQRAERALAAGDAHLALVESDHALATDPTNLRAHLARGDAHARLGDAAHALAAYARVLDVRRTTEVPEDLRARVDRAELAVRRGQP